MISNLKILIPSYNNDQKLALSHFCFDMAKAQFAVGLGGVIIGNTTNIITLTIIGLHVIFGVVLIYYGLLFLEKG